MNTTIKQTPLLIIDFGSQYTQLIGRRIREMNVYCEIHPFDVDITVIKKLQPCGIILSGGPSTATILSNPRAPDWVFDSELPVLGICYGMQVMAVQHGGEVVASNVRELGLTQLHVHNNSRLLHDLADVSTSSDSVTLDVWMSHGDKVLEIPPEFNVICATNSSHIAGMEHKSRHWYGIQFHPEVTHTLQGMRILRRFVFDICKAAPTWTADNIIQDSIANIRKQVGKDKVILALSGGVDSSVVAALLHRAIGAQLTCVFVDTGLLRLNEAAQIMAMFKQHLHVQVIKVDAEEIFLKALVGIDCPEEKRKIIGKNFIDVFEQQAHKIGDANWLAQGTIYSDVIESGAAHLTGASDVIKSHHNVGGLPERMRLQLLEPIRLLFKDEVRKMGRELGMPAELIQRHPFPGAGLGIRVLGIVKKEYLNLLRRADAIFMESLQKEGLYHEVSQAFAVFLPVKSVGVMGDARRYDPVICLRAVVTQDFMTAHWAKLPWDFLDKVSQRIVNEVPGISRVTYDISGKPPATIEWE